MAHTISPIQLIPRMTIKRQFTLPVPDYLSRIKENCSILQVINITNTALRKGKNIYVRKQAEKGTYFFNAEQRSSTNKSSRNHNPVAVIPKYDRESEMPED